MTDVRDAIIAGLRSHRGHPLKHTDGEQADCILVQLAAAGFDVVKRGHWIAFQPDTGGVSSGFAKQATGED